MVFGLPFLCLLTAGSSGYLYAQKETAAQAQTREAHAWYMSALANQKFGDDASRRKLIEMYSSTVNSPTALNGAMLLALENTSQAAARPTDMMTVLAFQNARMIEQNARIIKLLEGMQPKPN